MRIETKFKRHKEWRDYGPARTWKRWTFWESWWKFWESFKKSTST